MTRIALLCLVLLPVLGACSALDPDSYMTNAECRQKAYDDPAVQQRIARDAASHYSPLGEETLADLKQRAYVDCLRRRGLAPKGGVEPVKRN